VLRKKRIPAAPGIITALQRFHLRNREGAEMRDMNIGVIE
jgi:hypothetical protein